MSAQFVDALKGYGFFLESRGKASKDEVNDYLLEHGRRPISPRTYRHYNSLLAHGFEGYIPINKFDVFQSLGRLQMAADRRRYFREIEDLHCEISRNKKSWVAARIIDRSLVGFGVLSSTKFAIKPGSQLWIRIEGYKDIPSILVWRKHQDTITRMGLRAIEFVAKYRLVEEDILEFRLKGLLRVSKTPDGELEWREFYRVFAKVDELLDATGSLIYAVADYASTEITLAKPIIHSIRYGSPGETQIKIDFGVADIIRTVIEKIQFWGLEKKKFRQEDRKRELENANLEIEVVRNAVNLRREILEQGLSEEVASEMMAPMRRVLGIKELPADSFSPESLERGILNDRLLPAATELVAGDDPDIDIEVETEETE